MTSRRQPELDHYGIHLFASARSDGEVILRDSHEYGAAISPFDKPEIDDLMLREARSVFRLADHAGKRWLGEGA